MKKIKLLAPIIGATVIPFATVATVSCGDTKAKTVKVKLTSKVQDIELNVQTLEVGKDAQVELKSTTQQWINLDTIHIYLGSYEEEMPKEWYRTGLSNDGLTAYIDFDGRDIYDSVYIYAETENKTLINNFKTDEADETIHYITSEKFDTWKRGQEGEKSCSFVPTNWKEDPEELDHLDIRLYDNNFHPDTIESVATSPLWILTAVGEEPLSVDDDFTFIKTDAKPGHGLGWRLTEAGIKKVFNAKRLLFDAQLDNTKDNMTIVITNAVIA